MDRDDGNGFQTNLIIKFTQSQISDDQNSFKSNEKYEISLQFCWQSVRPVSFSNLVKRIPETETATMAICRPNRWKSRWYFWWEYYEARVIFYNQLGYFLVPSIFLWRIAEHFSYVNLKLTTILQKRPLYFFFVIRLEKGKPTSGIKLEERLRAYDRPWKISRILTSRTYFILKDWTEWRKISGLLKLDKCTDFFLFK